MGREINCSILANLIAMLQTLIRTVCFSVLRYCSITSLIP